MRYHDFHLVEYRVSDRGTRITFHLVFDYAGMPKDESRIEFSGVRLYDFTHTAGAIITDIEEVRLADLFDEVGGKLHEWQRQYGLSGWRDTLESYRLTLESSGFKAWRIHSAIGFDGFVVGQAVRQLA